MKIIFTRIKSVREDGTETLIGTDIDGDDVVFFGPNERFSIEQDDEDEDDG